MNDFEKYLIRDNQTARDALRQIDQLAKHGVVLFVVDEHGKVKGSMTDGDIRRGLLKDLNIDGPVDLFMEKGYKYVDEGSFSKDTIKSLKQAKIEYVPFLDKSGSLTHIVNTYKYRSVLPIHAVIMAGGRGERLLPLTEHTPKPLLQVGGKPIIEHNIDRIASYGIRHITIALSYLGEQIEACFGDGRDKNIHIDYVHETKPLGTIGAVSLIDEIKQDTVLLMNSDLLTNIDLEDFYDHFSSSEVDMQVASIPYDVNVPYAVMELSDTNHILGFKEKPKYVYYSSAGIYVMKKEVLNLIPENERFHATDLMQAVIDKGFGLKSEAIQGYWLDIGRIEDYNRAQHDFPHIDF